MEYNAVSIPISPAPPATINNTKERNGPRRSVSGQDLRKHSTMRRAYSDNHLSCSINRTPATSKQSKQKSSHSMEFFPFQFLGFILPTSLPETSKGVNMEEKDISVEEQMVESIEAGETKRVNWIERLVEINRHWKNKISKESMDPDLMCKKEKHEECACDEDQGTCEVSYEEEHDEEDRQKMTYDRDSFSKFLVQVPRSVTKLFSLLAFLGRMAYVIPQIKEMDLRRYYGLEFITSSLEKKAEMLQLKAKLDQDSTHIPLTASVDSQDGSEQDVSPNQKRQILPSVAYKIAAAAASYVQSRAKDLLSLGSKSQQQNEGESSTQEAGGSPRFFKSDVAASTMTAVVAAGEKEKQEAAKDLQSLQSSPCEWFICDNSSTYTRYFVIQGSYSPASWLANLFFEPIKFEETAGLVHRGIYEAAKGLYKQFMPEIMDHLKKYGERAKLQFTGHSLGGSLSLLIHLMLITRKVVRPSALWPVVTFGAPFVFCGGGKMLHELGLEESQINCVMMHRDIVPRVFSCNYPNYIAKILKRLNGKIRSHPCLIKNKLLYSPVGKMFILQPDEKTSPPHPLLPPGSALYAIDSTISEYSSSVLRAFLNYPHPLGILSHLTAYGSGGTIQRDHSSSNYLKAVNGVLRHHKKAVCQERNFQINHLWPLLTSPSPQMWSHEQNLAPVGRWGS